MGCIAYPFGLREWLPCVGVPLRQGEPDVPLDLQFSFNRTYEGGPYGRGAVDYSRPPQPPLEVPDAAWADELLRLLRSKAQRLVLLESRLAC